MQNAPANAPRLGFFAALPLRGDFFWRRLVAFYCIARACVWTLVLWITQPALPLDVLEHLAWGREWRVVYANHPGLPAWINEAVNAAFGGSGLALAATAPAATSAAMWAAYLLARRLATAPFAAAAAALALEGVYYFNAAATEFNHNTAQLTACAFLAWATHAAFLPAGGRAGWRRWAVLGVVAAAGQLRAQYGVKCRQPCKTRPPKPLSALSGATFIPPNMSTSCIAAFVATFRRPLVLSPLSMTRRGWTRA